MVTERVTPRIDPLAPPHDAEIETLLSKMTPRGVPPIALFRTVVRNPQMTEAMQPWGRYELGRTLSLSVRYREIVIDRTCARCHCEYEWGVHVAFFAGRANLEERQIASLAWGTAEDRCWSDERDRLLIRAVDALCDDADIDDSLWNALSSEFDDRQLLDLTMLCGWYHAISFTANAARVPLESGGPTFSSVSTIR